MNLATLQQTLYADVPGYSLSSAGRTKIEREWDSSLTYGEVTPEAVETMLSQVTAKDGEVFYDLGCGTGKAVIFAAFLHNFARCVGIDLVWDLWQAADQVRARYETEIQPLFPAERQGQQISFINGNFLEQDISDADIVFTHCTCFGEDLMQGITAKVEQLKPGARVITVTKSLLSPVYESLGSLPYRMAWGESTLHFHRRV